MIERGIWWELVKMMMKCVGHNIGSENQSIVFAKDNEVSKVLRR